MKDEAATMLVVEAEEETQAELRALGLAEGCNVLVAASGHDALLALGEHGPHLRLIIVSLDLPDMGWISVIARVREMSRHLPVIVTTMAHTEATELFARRLGAVLYAPKPLDPDLLRQAVLAALRAGESQAALGDRVRR